MARWIVEPIGGGAEVRAPAILTEAVEFRTDKYRSDGVVRGEFRQAVRTRLGRFERVSYLLDHPTNGVTAFQHESLDIGTNFMHVVHAGESRPPANYRCPSDGVIALGKRHGGKFGAHFPMAIDGLYLWPSIFRAHLVYLVPRLAAATGGALDVRWVDPFSDTRNALDSGVATFHKTGTITVHDGAGKAIEAERWSVSGTPDPDLTALVVTRDALVAVVGARSVLRLDGWTLPPDATRTAAP